MSNNLLLVSLNGEATAPLTARLARANVVVNEVRSLGEAERALLRKPFRVLIARYDGVSESCLRLLKFVREHRLPTHVILLSKTGAVRDAVNVLKEGAGDFIVSNTLDAATAESVLQSMAHLGESDGSKQHVEKKQKLDTILIGNSQAIQDVRSAVHLVAKSQTPVLITGESGTGKEVVARSIHLQSDRADKPFIAINCAALPKDVIENELFGHERGAFTGATDKKAGCFELASTGTIFFDEIAEMTTETQAKLLRAIEDKSFRRLGGKEELKVDARTVAATNKKMAEALKSGEFREDLYYRFSVIEIFMPPLREMAEDIPLLAEHFLSRFVEQYKKRHQRLSEKTMESLCAYEWPGNVRELRNVVERCVVTCQEAVIHPRYLPDRLTSTKRIGSTLNIPIGISLAEAERKFILHTIAACGNNKTRAAQVLGLSRKTLHNRLQKVSV
ncbi:MAG: sigma-54 dependent transcriptional regulator [Bacteroidota bacterium]